MAAAFKRSGLHKLECPCGAYVYATVAALERHGLPRCACGESFAPERLELAGMLGVRCDALEEYERELGRVMHGQAPHGIRGRVLRAAEEIAAERVEARRRERARENRLQALRPQPDPMPF